MTISLREAKKQMKKLIGFERLGPRKLRRVITPRIAEDYEHRRVKSLQEKAAPGINALTFTAIVEGSERDGEEVSHKTSIRFFGVEYSNEKKTGYVPVKMGDRTVYAKKPSVKDNGVQIKCSCFTGDTLIPLVDGRSVPIKDLVGLDYFYVYSFDVQSNRFVVGKAHTCEIKEKNAEIVKVTLDSGEEIFCTPDHRFLLKDGTYKRVDEIKPNDSIEVLYKRLGSDKLVKNYEQVLQRTGWEFTHHLSDIYNLENNIYSKSSGTIRHHQDFNKFNNSPENILRMVSSVMAETKRKLGQYIGCGFNFKSKERVVRRKISDTRKRKIKSGEIALSNFEKCQEKNSELFKSGKHYLQSEQHRLNMKRYNAERLKQGIHPFKNESNRKKTSLRNTRILKDPSEQLKRIRERCVAAIKKVILEYGYWDESLYKGFVGYPSLKTIKRFDLNELIKEATNHKILSIERVGNADVYCFTVNKYHNFVVDVGNNSGVVAHNCEDFRFYWEYPLYKKKGLIGTFRRYSRKTLPPPEGRPYKNVTEQLGFCKHIWNLLVAFRTRGDIRE